MTDILWLGTCGHCCSPMRILLTYIGQRIDLLRKCWLPGQLRNSQSDSHVGDRLHCGVCKRVVVGPHQGHDQGPFFSLTGRPIHFVKRWVLALGIQLGHGTSACCSPRLNFFYRGVRPQNRGPLGQQLSGGAGLPSFAAIRKVFPGAAFSLAPTRFRFLQDSEPRSTHVGLLLCHCKLGLRILKYFL